MKKLSKIKLHNLCQTEMAERDQHVLRGGAAYCGCVTVCTGSICGCFEETQDTVDVTLKNINEAQTEKKESDNNTNSNNRQE